MFGCLLAVQALTGCAALGPANQMLELAVQIEEKPSLVGQTTVQGNEAISDFFILRELGLAAGQVVFSRDILAAEQKLARLPLFNKVVVKVSDAYGHDRIKDIHITVEENAAGRLFGRMHQLAWQVHDVIQSIVQPRPAGVLEIQR